MESCSSSCEGVAISRLAFSEAFFFFNDSSLSRCQSKRIRVGTKKIIFITGRILQFQSLKIYPGLSSFGEHGQLAQGKEVLSPAQIGDVFQVKEPYPQGKSNKTKEDGIRKCIFCSKDSWNGMRWGKIKELQELLPNLVPTIKTYHAQTWQSLEAPWKHKHGCVNLFTNTKNRISDAKEQVIRQKLQILINSHSSGQLYPAELSQIRRFN